MLDCKSECKEMKQKIYNYEELLRDIIKHYNLNEHSMNSCGCELCQLIRVGEELLNGRV